MEWSTLDPDIFRHMMLAYWLSLAFVLGAVVGSFVNVAVARLPVEKSLIWPGSRCGLCMQAIRWYDNLPLISFVSLRGRCRSCGGRFSIRYFWVELATALGFMGLFWLDVVKNIHGWSPIGPRVSAMPPWQWLIGFAYHAILFSFLMAASVCDLKSREIPLPLTLTGTMIGLIGATLLPWPWPWTPEEATPRPRLGFGFVAWQNGEIKQGIYPWPFWGPLPEFFDPGGNWETGLATGLAGALVGTFLMRAVGFIFSKGLGKEAMGLGDADLMMMAGAFLGWQVIVVGFLLSAFPALVFGVIRYVCYRDNALPFGPSLSVGVLGTYLVWHALAPAVQPFFFWGLIMICLAAAAAGIMLVLAFMFRLAKR